MRKSVRSRKVGGQAEWFTYPAIWDEFLILPVNTLTSLPLLGTQPLTQPVPGGAAAPVINQQKVVLVDARIQVASNNGVVAEQIYAGVGLYASEWDTDTTVWTQQDPLEPADVLRTDWMELKTGSINYLAGIAPQTVQTVTFSFRRSMNMLVGNGKALFLALSNSNNSSSAAVFYLNVRLKVINDL